MSWPTPQDYNEAIQSPRLSFSDSDLQAGTPELTSLGLPCPITGGFASVFRIRCNSRDWAVRCFLRDFPDHQERYAAIGRSLAELKLPYTVGFDFIQEGIRVRGQWYPVLKMEWIDGASLKDAIEASISNPMGIRNLADRWLVMLRALKRSGIAHGDLQHGNILVSGADFRLIDYDGVFVPALAGRHSHEVGHRNYQHPGRTEKDFGPYLDNFSGWAIYLTLVALSVDPGLWPRFGAGEEHLLFKKEDFEEPRYSRTFRAVEQLRDDRIQKYVPLLKSMLRMPVTSLPSVAETVGVPARPRPSKPALFPAWGGDGGDSRDTRTIPRSVPRPRAQADAAETATSKAALLEQLEQFELPLRKTSESAVEPDRAAVNPVSFSDTFAGERVGVATYSLMSAGLITMGARGTVSGEDVFAVLMAGLACLTLFIACCYVSCPEVRARFRVWLLKEWYRNERIFARQVFERLAGLHAWLDVAEQRSIEEIEARRRRRVEREKERVAEVRRSLSSWLDDLESRRQALELAAAQEPQARVAALQNRYHREVAQLREVTKTVYPDMGWRDARVFRKWQTRLQQLLQAGPPMQLSAPDLEEIRRCCTLETESLKGCAAFVRLGAQKKIKRIRRQRTRHRAQIRASLERTRARFAGRRERLQARIESVRIWLDRNRIDLSQYVNEFSRYAAVRFPRYLQCILIGHRKASTKVLQ